MDQEVSVLTTLHNFNRRARTASFGHFAAAERLSRYHYYIGIPTVVFSAIVGTTAFTSSTEGKIESQTAVFVIVSVSILAAVLAALQTFFNFNQRREQHLASAAEFAKIRRTIEVELAIAANQGGGAVKPDLVRSISEQYNNASKNAPLVLRSDHAKGQKKEEAEDSDGI